MNTALAAVLGAGFGVGIGMLYLCWRLWPADTDHDAAPASTGRAGAAQVRRVAVAAVVGTAVWVVTGWLACAVAAAALAWYAPTLVGGKAKYRAELERTEAIAAFVESVRDNLEAAAALDGAVLAAAEVVQPGIESETAQLAADLRSGTGLAPSLRAWAERVDDEIADLAAVALIQAVELPGNLSAVLSELADAAHDEAALRSRLHANRARTRSSVQLVTVITAGMLVFLLAVAGTYLDAFDTLTGQLVLAFAFGQFAAGLWWLQRMARSPKPPSLLREATAETGRAAS